MARVFSSVYYFHLFTGCSRLSHLMLCTCQDQIIKEFFFFILVSLDFFDLVTGKLWIERINTVIKKKEHINCLIP